MSLLKYNKRLTVLVVLIVLTCAAGCAVQKNPFIGTWRYELGPEWEEITFNSDMTYTITRYTLVSGLTSGGGTYSYTSTTLTLKVDILSVEYGYEFSGSNLHITLGEIELIYVRQ